MRAGKRMPYEGFLSEPFVPTIERATTSKAGASKGRSLDGAESVGMGESKLAAEKRRRAAVLISIDVTSNL